MPNSKKYISQALILRRPTEQEQRDAKIVTSDYQISSLTIQSSILNSFGLSSKIYRSKNTLIQKNTKKKVEKYLNIFNSFFKNFEDDTPIDEFLERTTRGAEFYRKQCGVNIADVLKGMRSWNSVSTFDKIKDKLDNIKEKKKLSISNTSLIAKILNGVFQKESKRFETPKLFSNSLSISDSFTSIMNDPFMESIKEDVYTFNEVGENPTVKDLKEFIFLFLNKQSHESVTKHSQTVLNEQCLEKQNKIIKTLEADGIKGGLTVDNLFKYILKYDQLSAQTIKLLYNLDISKKKFKNFEEMALFFYEPQMMREIREGLHVNVRSRRKGDLRKGTELGIDKKQIDNKIKKYKKTIGDSYSQENETAKIKCAKINLDEKENLYAKAKKSRQNIKKELKQLKISGDSPQIEKAEKLLNNATELLDHLRADLAYARKSYQKALKQADLKAQAVKKLDEITKEKTEILNNLESSRDYDGNEIEILKSIELKKRLEEDDIPYLSWSFAIEGIDRDICSYISNELESVLSKEKNGKPTYINVSSFFVNNNASKITEFFIDYPSSSKLCKALTCKKSLASEILESLKLNVIKKLNRTINYIEERFFYNRPMEKTLFDTDYQWN